MKELILILVSLVLPCTHSFALPQTSSASGGEATLNSVPNVGTGGLSGRRVTPGRYNYLTLGNPRRGVHLRLGRWGFLPVDDSDFGAIIKDGFHWAQQEDKVGLLWTLFNYTYDDPWRVETHFIGCNVWNSFITNSWPMTWYTFNQTMFMLEYFQEHYIPIEATFDIWEGTRLMGQGNFTNKHTKPLQPPQRTDPPPPTRPGHRIPSSHRPLLVQGNQSAEAVQSIQEALSAASA